MLFSYFGQLLQSRMKKYVKFLYIANIFPCYSCILLSSSNAKYRKKTFKNLSKPIFSHEFVFCTTAVVQNIKLTWKILALFSLCYSPFLINNMALSLAMLFSFLCLCCSLFTLRRACSPNGERCFLRVNRLQCRIEWKNVSCVFSSCGSLGSVCDNQSLLVVVITLTTCLVFGVSLAGDTSCRISYQYEIFIVVEELRRADCAVTAIPETCCHH